jgi:hypothetical protein
MATVTAEQLPGLVSAGGLVAPGSLGWSQWVEMLTSMRVEDLRFRMLFKHEVGRACGFDPDFPDRPGEFKVWGSTKAQIDGYGNAVTPGVGQWIGLRLRDCLHSMDAILPVGV